MHVFYRKGELVSFLEGERKKNHSIGLVPTMGALHRGHISLVEKALSENDLTVVSIFVNPTQFDQRDDLEKYPRNLQRDLDLLQGSNGRLAVYSPSVEEIYGGDVNSQIYDFDGLDQVMEGAFRKGHFNGVGTVVELLLRTVGPDRAYFGEKDFQQLQIIRKMTEIKNLPYAIIGCPIEREPNGLAMSSRNERLSSDTRAEAGIIHQGLMTAKTHFGTENAERTKARARSLVEGRPGFEVEYFEIADEADLRPMVQLEPGHTYRAFIAVYADGVRLIDNLRLN